MGLRDKPSSGDVSTSAVAPCADGPDPGDPYHRRLTPEVVAARHAASQVLAAACYACGGQSAFARAAGVSHSQVSRWCDPACTDPVPLGDLLTSPAVARHVCAAILARL